MTGEYNFTTRPIEDQLNARIEELESALNKIFAAFNGNRSQEAQWLLSVASEALKSEERTLQQIAQDFDDLFDQIPEPETDDEIKADLEDAGYDVDELKENGMKFVNDLISELKNKTDAEAPANAETSTSDLSD